jgi:hypothetical protein
LLKSLDAASKVVEVLSVQVCPFAPKVEVVLTPITRP